MSINPVRRLPIIFGLLVAMALLLPMGAAPSAAQQVLSAPSVSPTVVAPTQAVVSQAVHASPVRTPAVQQPGPPPDQPPIALPDGYTPSYRLARSVADSASPTTWRVLLLVYHNTDVDYVEDGVTKHMTTSLSQTDVDKALARFDRFKQYVSDYSANAADIDATVVHVTRAVNSITAIGSSYWLSPNDTRGELNTYAPRGAYDSVEALWQPCSDSTGKCIPPFGWGASISASDWSNGATYASMIFGWSVWWDWEADSAQLYLHEWLHGAMDFYSSLGYVMPLGGLDSAGEHGYTNSPVDSWAAWYRVVMTGRVWEPTLGVYTGITTEAWRSGSIITHVSMPTPTQTPTNTPTHTPPATPTNTPTRTPSPTLTPAHTPTNTSTHTPTVTPTNTLTYTISGRVTDASGAGIPGVTVWAGFPRNTTTDANGNYTFTGLPAGTYNITPDKAPCTFTPATQTVTIPPGKALPDFTSTRLASGLDVCILEPGDILLKASAPVGDYTDLIRFWIKLGGSYFTHSALYLGVTSDPQNPAQTGPRITEAGGKKKLGGSRDDEVWETWLANTQWWDGKDVTDWAVVRPGANSEAKAIAIQYARGKAADPNVVFDFLADLEDEQKFYCSKLVWKSYQQAGVDVHKKTGLTGDLTSYWITPEDLYFGSPVVQNMPGVDPSTRAFFRIYSPAHITLTDPLGRRTGFNPSSGGEVNEIPGALYTGIEAQIESVTVAGLGSSEGWRLLVTGYASGAYTLETGYLDARTRNWETHAMTSEGKVDEFPAHPPNYPSYLPLLLR